MLSALFSVSFSFLARRGNYFRPNHIRKVPRRCSHSRFSSQAIIVGFLTETSACVMLCFSVAMGDRGDLCWVSHHSGLHIYYLANLKISLVESGILGFGFENEIQLKDSRIPQTIRIQNPISSIVKDWNHVNPWSRIQNPRLSFIPLHDTNNEMTCSKRRLHIRRLSFTKWWCVSITTCRWLSACKRLMCSCRRSVSQIWVKFCIFITCLFLCR